LNLEFETLDSFFGLGPRPRRPLPSPAPPRVSSFPQHVACTIRKECRCPGGTARGKRDLILKQQILKLGWSIEERTVSCWDRSGPRHGCGWRRSSQHTGRSAVCTVLLSHYSSSTHSPQTWHTPLRCYRGNPVHSAQTRLSLQECDFRHATLMAPL
jgi:hypothetical protein